MNVREKRARAPNAVNNLKNFIELPNSDADVVVSKRIIKIFKNEADEEEKDIVVKVIEKEKEKKDEEQDEVVQEGVKVVDVDDSIEVAVEAGETEAECIEDVGILVSDGEEEVIREYVTNLCVPRSQKSELMTGGRKRKVINSADSESWDEESGS
jgi:intracellular sulfur oxidation DsrE/DsrF family protein